MLKLKIKTYSHTVKFSGIPDRATEGWEALTCACQYTMNEVASYWERGKRRKCSKCSDTKRLPLPFSELGISS